MTFFDVMAIIFPFAMVAVFLTIIFSAKPAQP